MWWLVVGLPQHHWVLSAALCPAVKHAQQCPVICSAVKAHTWGEKIDSKNQYAKHQRTLPCSCSCSCTGALMQAASASALTPAHHVTRLLPGYMHFICNNSAHALASLMQHPLQPVKTCTGVEEGHNRGQRGLMQGAHANALTMLLLCCCS